MQNLKTYDTPFEGTTMRCHEGGSGVPIVFLHGSGAGVQTGSNFKTVLGPLSKKYHVLAADLIGFGQSGGKTAEPYFDMDMWVRQALDLIGRFKGEKVVLVGHSLSGAIVLKAAARSDRVRGVITTGTTGAPLLEGRPGPRWRYPEGRDAVRAAVERTFFDKTLATEEEVDARLAILTKPGYRAYFEAMFGGDSLAYQRASVVTDQELAAISCPVVLMHGIQDATFSPEDSSLLLARGIRDSKVVVLNRCAHSVAVEHTDTFLATVDDLVRITSA